jgi:hypothetical protein
MKATVTWLCLANLVHRLGRSAVTLHLEALQIPGQPHLGAEDFQHEVGVLQQFLALLAVLGPEQNVSSKSAGELAPVVTRPQDQVVGIDEDRLYFVSPTNGH